MTISEQTLELVEDFMRSPRLMIGDQPMLRSQCDDIPEGFDISNIFEPMLHFMKAHRGVGLAAPQIGLPINVLVAHCPDWVYGEPIVLVNPVIETRWEETAVEDEGCLSFPGITIPVERSRRISLTAQNETGIVLCELEARVVQHEYDHLQGICHIDYKNNLPRQQRRRIERDLVKFEERVEKWKKTNQ